MSELFIASDPLTKLKDYAVYNGELQGGYYSVLMGASDNGLNVYARALYYEESTGEILLSMAVQGVCEVGIFIEKLNGQYTWVYMDVDGCQMSGIINAGEFNDSSLLDYKDAHNIADYKHASNVRNYATLLIQLLLISFDGDYANTGVTAGDLGFSNF